MRLQMINFVFEADHNAFETGPRHLVGSEEHLETTGCAGQRLRMQRVQYVCLHRPYTACETALEGLLS
eukprot:g72536.t1